MDAHDQERLFKLIKNLQNVNITDNDADTICYYTNHEVVLMGLRLRNQAERKAIDNKDKVCWQDNADRTELVNDLEVELLNYTKEASDSAVKELTEKIDGKKAFSLVYLESTKKGTDEEKQKAQKEFDNLTRDIRESEEKLAILEELNEKQNTERRLRRIIGQKRKSEEERETAQKDLTKLLEEKKDPSYVINNFMEENTILSDIYTILLWIEATRRLKKEKIDTLESYKQFVIKYGKVTRYTNPHVLNIFKMARDKESIRIDTLFGQVITKLTRVKETINKYYPQASMDTFVYDRLDAILKHVDEFTIRKNDIIYEIKKFSDPALLKKSISDYLKEEKNMGIKQEYSNGEKQKLSILFDNANVKTLSRLMDVIGNVRTVGTAVFHGIITAQNLIEGTHNRFYTTLYNVLPITKRSEDEEIERKRLEDEEIERRLKEIEKRIRERERLIINATRKRGLQKVYNELRKRAATARVAIAKRQAARVAVENAKTNEHMIIMRREQEAEEKAIRESRYAESMRREMARPKPYKEWTAENLEKASKEEKAKWREFNDIREHQGNVLATTVLRQKMIDKNAALRQKIKDNNAGNQGPQEEGDTVTAVTDNNRVQGPIDPRPPVSEVKTTQDSVINKQNRSNDPLLKENENNTQVNYHALAHPNQAALRTQPTRRNRPPVSPTGTNSLVLSPHSQYISPVTPNTVKNTFKCKFNGKMKTLRNHLVKLST